MVSKNEKSEHYNPRYNFQAWFAISVRCAACQPNQKLNCQKSCQKCQSKYKTDREKWYENVSVYNAIGKK